MFCVLWEEQEEEAKEGCIDRMEGLLTHSSVQEILYLEEREFKAKHNKLSFTLQSRETKKIKVNQLTLKSAQKAVACFPACLCVSSKPRSISSNRGMSRWKM